MELRNVPKVKFDSLASERVYIAGVVKLIRLESKRALIAETEFRRDL